jgi:hypothetical protein
VVVWPSGASADPALDSSSDPLPDGAWVESAVPLGSDGALFVWRGPEPEKAGVAVYQPGPFWQLAEIGDGSSVVWEIHAAPCAGGDVLVSWIEEEAPGSYTINAFDVSADGTTTEFGLVGAADTKPRNLRGGAFDDGRRTVGWYVADADAQTGSLMIAEYR